MKYTISLVDTGEDYFCREDQHLLQGMQNYQIGKAMLDTIPVGCRGGGCGICRIRILNGEYEAKKMSRKHITEEQQALGIVLACRIYPRADLGIEVLPVVDAESKTAEEGI